MVTVLFIRANSMYGITWQLKTGKEPWFHSLLHSHRPTLKSGGVSKSMLTLNEAIIDVKKG